MEIQDQTDILEALLAINSALLVLANNLPPEASDAVIREGQILLKVCTRMLERKKAHLPPGLLGRAMGGING